MLKEYKEREEREHLKRDLKYRINHAISVSKKELNDSTHEPVITKESGDKSLKKRKELLLREMELLKKSKE